ncbi:MAG: amino acid adenylation domain-containing protein [Candidatus Omnitrophota bacterium]
MSVHPELFNLFSKLRRLGIKIHLTDDDNLKINAPKGSMDSVLMEELKVNKSHIIAFLKEAKKNSADAFTHAEEREYYILSSAQKRLYFFYRLNNQGIEYNISTVLKLDGRLDKTLIANVFKHLVQRHDSFRTSFQMIGDEPVQVICDRVELDLEWHDLFTEGKRGTTPEAVIKSFVRPFDLSQAPLIRVGMIRVSESTYFLMVDMHHIISDGTSTGILIKEFSELYMASDMDRALPPVNFQYKDYAVWQKSAAYRKRLQDQEAFWLDYFEGEMPVLQLPTDYPRPVFQSFEGVGTGFEIGEEETARLHHLEKKGGLTLFIVLLSIYNVLLHKLSGQEDIIVGSPVAGRSEDDWQSIIGMFVNTVALRNFPVGDQSFLAFLEEVKKRTLGVFENQDYPFEDIVEKLVINRDISRNPVFDVMFTLQNFDWPESNISGLKLRPYEYDPGTSKVDLMLSGGEVDGKLFCGFQYCIKLFNERTILRFIDYYKQLVTEICADPSKKICELEIMSSQEKTRILYEFNEASMGYPAEKTLHELVEEQVRQIPDHIAVIGTFDQGAFLKNRPLDPQKTFGHLTYHELNKQSDLLANLLIQRRVQADTIVGIKIERSIEMIIGILGILKAGGAYLPIDVDYPQERIDYMLKDSGVQVLITEREFEAFRRGAPACAPGSNSENIKIGQTHGSAPTENLSEDLLSPLPATGHRKLATSLAYVIYTSGSTGKPKGVLTVHSNVPRVVKDTNYIQLTSQDRILQLSNYAFDGSVFDICGALLNGAALVMIGKKDLLEIEKLGDLIRRECVTVFFATTALFNMLVELRVESLNNVRKVIFGGERASLAHSRKALEYLGKGRIMNAYGPTETTVFASMYAIDHIDKTASAVPIGKPLTNTVVYILDKYMNPVPVGISGEVYIGGEGTARGYLNNPELTAQRFISVTSVSSVANKASQLYKTGDLGKWTEDGNIEFLGRMDSQIKMRGFRIEIGEIENHILRQDGISDAVVIMRQDASGDKYLCAYIVHQGQTSIDVLRESLGRVMPSYMVPAHFVEMETIPLTANGKVDRRSLPEPVFNADERYDAPGSELEEKLAGIWSEVLGVKGRVGVDDDFFRLGGHSLKATVLVSHIYRELNVKIPLVTVFQAPTVRQLAVVISQSQCSAFIDIPKIENADCYPLSFNQRRLYVLHQMQPESPAFNMPMSFDLNHDVDPVAAGRIFEYLSNRHESLRTAFKLVDDCPFQFIVEAIKLPFEFIDLSMMAETEKQDHLMAIHNRIAAAPFDLFQPPLFRVALIKTEPSKCRLLFNIHHIVSDGWSLDVLKSEFNQLYTGYLQSGNIVEIPPHTIEYKDFAVWHNTWLESSESEPSRSYWREKLKDGVPFLQLPADFEIGRNDLAGAAWSYPIDGEFTDRLKHLAEENNVTLFTVMFSVYLMLLSGVSNQKDVSCSMISAGRDHPSLHHIVGFFVNSIILKVQVDDQKPFNLFLQDVNKEVMDVFQHQRYPLEMIFEEMGIKYPDISASFNMFNVGSASEAGMMESFEPVHRGDAQDVKFDLEVYATEMANGISMSWVYKRNMFQPETMRYMISRYVKQLDFFCKNPSGSLKEYSLEGSGSAQKAGRFKKNR